jgi:hypothetical protein
MKRVKPTRCYTTVYWTLRFARHVSGIIMPIIRSLRLYRWPQRVAPHLGYGRLLVWCMAVGLSVRIEGCCTTCNIPLSGCTTCNIPLPGCTTCNIPLPGCLNLQPCTRPATCHNQGEAPHAGAICTVASSWWWAWRPGRGMLHNMYIKGGIFS